jgi:acetyl-CoA acetyltransferase
MASVTSLSEAIGEIIRDGDTELDPENCELTGSPGRRSHFPVPTTANCERAGGGGAMSAAYIYGAVRTPFGRYAGNSSPLNDGASMLLLGSESAAAALGSAPLARVVSRGVHGLDPEKVNMSGGAIAIGHPLGASGARVVGRAVHELRARGGRYGLAALCIGVGQGLAMVVEVEG